MTGDTTQFFSGCVNVVKWCNNYTATTHQLQPSNATTPTTVTTTNTPTAVHMLTTVTVTAYSCVIYLEQ